MPSSAFEISFDNFRRPKSHLRIELPEQGQLSPCFLFSSSANCTTCSFPQRSLSSFTTHPSWRWVCPAWCLRGCPPSTELCATKDSVELFCNFESLSHSALGQVRRSSVLPSWQADGSALEALGPWHLNFNLYTVVWRTLFLSLSG